jgi:hypothetical protein
MGTVLGLTAARTLEIEAASVVSGVVNSSGDLILTTHGGTDIDAGHVRASNYDVSSETAPGIIQIATTAETLTGTNALKAVTPADLTARTATLSEVTTGTDNVKAVTSLGLRQERKLVTTYTGIIESGWSTGKPKVTLDPGQDVSGVVSCFLAGNLDDSIIASAAVILTRTNAGNWVILDSYADRPRFMRQIPLTIEPGFGWFLNSDNINTDQAHQVGEGPSNFGGSWESGIGAAGTPYATCTKTGIVTIEGLISNSTGISPAVGTIITRFPMSLVPTRNQIFETIAGNSGGQVAVCTDGTVRYISGDIAFLSLNAIRFRTAASVTASLATSVALTLNAGFISFNTALWTGEPGSTTHTPSYTIDSDNVAIFEGSVGVSTNKGAGSDIATCGAFTNDYSTHNVATMTGGFSTIVFGAMGGAAGLGKTISLGKNLNTGQFLSIANVLWLNQPTLTSLYVSKINSWVDYSQYSSDIWASPRFFRTPSGLVIMFGLWSTGTIGQAMTLIPDGSRPRFKSLLATVSVDAIARVDIGNPAAPNYGSQGVVPITGSNVWYSLDGVSWPAYR